MVEFTQLTQVHGDLFDRSLDNAIPAIFIGVTVGKIPDRTAHGEGEGMGLGRGEGKCFHYSFGESGGMVGTECEVGEDIYHVIIIGFSFYWV